MTGVPPLDDSLMTNESVTQSPIDGPTRQKSSTSTYLHTVDSREYTGITDSTEFVIGTFVYIK